jgi:SAM-dependent methyltransferase
MVATLQRVQSDNGLEKHTGIMLDIGCGANKLPNHVGMDIRARDGVDVVHSWNDLPWPFPDESALQIFASHVIEHVNPADGFFLDWMDEAWRIMKPGGRLCLITPYAGSHGFFQDPTHVNPCNETTFAYFDSEHPSGLYGFYQPRPWKIAVLKWDVAINIEIILEKRADAGL